VANIGFQQRGRDVLLILPAVEKPTLVYKLKELCNPKVCLNVQQMLLLEFLMGRAPLEMKRVAFGGNVLLVWKTLLSETKKHFKNRLFY
jgi:hypothetical protein